MNDNKYCLIGIDGNAYSIMGYTTQAMKECHYSKDEINDYLAKATAKDYYHLIFVSMNTIDECNKYVKENM